MALLCLSVSAILGAIGGVAAPEISDTLASWELRVATGLTVFFVIQFLIIAPCRMWRDVVQVTNIEKILNNGSIT
jgi:hypothetical protein